MRIAVIGATGNVGTSLLRALASEPGVSHVVGIARRMPELRVPKVSWRTADITTSRLEPLLAGADAVVHLAWAIQPSHDLEALRRTNVTGTARVLDAVAKAKVPALAYASSIGAYSPGPKDELVDEGWPTEGVATSFYSRHKSEVESLLDEFERGEAGTRIVRMRPALIFKREAATEIRRLFLGPFLPRIAFSRRAIPIVPDIPALRFQTVHSHDVADAFRRALLEPDARGAFNLASEPVLDPEALERILDARRVGLRPRVVRGAVSAAWRAHVQPSPPGWLDMALQVPLISSERARRELGWEPRVSSSDALLELLDGMRDGAGLKTPPLDPESSGPLRIRELRTGVGGRAY